MSQIIQIDVRGLRCPLPVLRLRKALGAVAPGAAVWLLADDPIAVVDIPHFCAEAGHDMVRVEDRGDAQAYLVRRAPDATAPG